MGTHPIFESDFDCLTDMKTGAFRDRVLRRIAHTRGLQLEDLQKLEDAEIITQFWHHLKLADLDHFSLSAVDSCHDVVSRMCNRSTRNKRFAHMKILEQNGYFHLANGF